MFGGAGGGGTLTFGGAGGGGTLMFRGAGGGGGPPEAKMLIFSEFEGTFFEGRIISVSEF